MSSGQPGGGDPGQRARGARVAVAAMVVVIGASSIGCPTPGIVAFAHPNPAPRAGHEIAVAGLGGVGLVGTGFEGGRLSWAARIGEGGLMVSGWGAPSQLWGGGSAGYVFDGSIEGAFPVEEIVEASEADTGWGEDVSEGPAPGAAHFFLVGARVHGTFEDFPEGEPDPNELFPTVNRQRFLAPEIGIGFQRRPSDGDTGGFWSVRLEGGPRVYLLDDGARADAAQFLLTFAGGGRFEAGERTYFTFQGGLIAAACSGFGCNIRGVFGMQSR